MIKFLNRLLLILLICSCSPKKQLSVDECNTASLNCFVGHPTECNKLKTQCNEVKIDYTKELCQEAFNSLIFGMKQNELETKYGDRITKCFSEDQKVKFLRN